MFWNDIAEIKHWMNRLTDRLCRIDQNLNELYRKGGKLDEFDARASSTVGLIEVHSQMTRDLIEGFFDSENEFGTLNRIHDKLNELVKDEDRKRQVELAAQTLDKFADYMKNVNKLNSMVNEFKGCVSLARGAIEERKGLDKQTEETKNLAKISKEIYQAMVSFVKAGENIKDEAHYKIDFIMKKVVEIAENLQKREKKSSKPRKSVKKKRKAPQAPLSGQF